MDKIVFTDGRIAGKAEPEEKRVAYIILSLLAVAIVIFTVIHQCFPSIFDVPSSEGIPMNNFPSLLTMDIFTIMLSWCCFRHAWKRLGLYAAAVFLGGSFVFTGIEESMFILMGRWVNFLTEPSIMGADGVTMVANGSYYFTRDLIWFIETPVTACLGWFFLAYSGVYIAELVIPKAPLWWKAAIGGFLPMNVDLWMDPIQTHPVFKTWIWGQQPYGIWIFGIPITNFIGWFMLIAIFAIVFDKLPGMVNRLGHAKAAIKIYCVLFALELFMLLTLGGYSMFERAFIPKTNLTLWGIGG